MEPFYCNDKYFYRPQHSCGKIIFSQASVILSTGGRHPPPGTHPLARHPPSRHPLGRHPQANTLPGQKPPLPSGCWDTHTPLHSACWDAPTSPPAGHCCGRYASYWNAFLLSLNSLNPVKTFRENSNKSDCRNNVPSSTWNRLSPHIMQ